jgi:hypothetical protein
MWTGTINVWHFFHGFALDAAVSSFTHLATADRVFTFLGCHFVSLLGWNSYEAVEQNTASTIRQKPLSGSHSPSKKSVYTGRFRTPIQ